MPLNGKLNRVGAAALIPLVLRDLGVDPADVFMRAEVDMAAIADPEALIPIGDLARVAALAAKSCGRPDFGLLVADRARTQQAGLLGKLFMSADHLRDALHSLIRYFHLNTRGGVAMLTVERGFAEVRLGLDGPYGEAATVFEDAVIGIFFHHLRAFLGEGWQPTEILLSHAAGADSDVYRRFFRAPVRFDALCTAVLLPADDLKRPMIGREREKQLLQAAATTASSRLEIRFEEEVRWAIRKQLAQGKPSVEAVARELGLGRRTLNRRLAQRGLTFAQLLRSVRFAIARQLLVESGTPLAEIATAIGYEEASVFSNAFRSWSGFSPSDWRRQHGRS